MEPRGLEVLAHSPALSLQGAFGVGQMVIRGKGAGSVFSSGAVDFVRLLGSPLQTQLADGRVARLVANVLFAALGREVPDRGPSTPALRAEATGPYARELFTLRVAWVPRSR
jgi:hypothetical protein